MDKNNELNFLEWLQSPAHYFYEWLHDGESVYLETMDGKLVEVNDENKRNLGDANKNK